MLIDTKLERGKQEYRSGKPLEVIPGRNSEKRLTDRAAFSMCGRMVDGKTSA